MRVQTIFLVLVLGGCQAGQASDVCRVFKNAPACRQKIAPPPQTAPAPADGVPPRMVYFDANETGAPMQAGLNPVLSSLTIDPNTLQDGSVIRVFGAFYQAGTVDPSLHAVVWWLDGDHLSDDVPVGQGTQFTADVLVFKTSGGGYLWKMQSYTLQEPLWPQPPKTFSNVDGGTYIAPGATQPTAWDPEMDDLDPTQPITVWIQVYGNVQESSQVTLHDFVVRVINP